MIIVGTHLDQVTTQRANSLVTLVKDLYTNKKEFPPIADVYCVHATAIMTSHVNNVRKKIYDVASHLYLVNNKGKYLGYEYIHIYVIIVFGFASGLQAR